ncbi:peptidase S41 [Marivirga tractuosa]|uniref:Carboxyl-terminal protease n=1 Tax=Marivirga tractuosa (strain ATCC 23168 / DSM 4126 / NBRC 15989 / NCIMB 1408 / VKM B-1430 / H-43) TaxID=643867 RepID=E4TNE0_MARTH|nr:carboxy terminal-processing peptidase [Marivirga tractuosa]ADR20397.1 carboxyl-terminal protease [Marivirga tractuosa DSM 4126]BDD15159.1 peptidase S41 [Marivirga tractuosa]
MNKVVVSILIIFWSISGFAQTEKLQKLSPTQDQSMEARLVAGLLTQYHYEKIGIDDELSKIVFDEYLSSLDANKHYFLKEDIEGFQKYRERLDDHMKLGYLLPPYEIFNTFRKRFEERMNFIENELEYNFDYEKEEYLTVNRDSLDYVATTEELNDRWRKIVKSQALDLKLDEKADTTIQRLIKERYDRLEQTISEYESRDVFQLYMNTFAESFDPHSSYFSPITSENFKIRMSQSLEGIGATLTSDGTYTKVASVVPGGPAFESKVINTDDKILAVAQGDDGEFVDITGWRLDDVVQKIRGPKGTVVRLKVIEAGISISAGVPQEIRIVRDKIKLENQVPYAEVKEVYRDGNQYNIGVVTIPSFYLDYETMRKGEDYGSTTKDVKAILDSIRSKVDGIVIDLRSNGGGSLQEAIELSGLFIEEGPIVQIRDSDGKIEMGKDDDKTIYYDGPLTVLTNRFSASASEIFSGAIQDYKRGVVIGENTFGKGTVQNLISLNQFVPKVEDTLGQVKLTLAKYYRVNGSSTQHKGVIPDIKMPSPYTAKAFGESSYERALEWDQIESSEYEPSNQINEQIIADLNEKHEKRLKDEQYLRNLKNDVDEAVNQQSMHRVSLNLEARKAENEAAMERRNAANELRDNITSDPELINKINTDGEIKDPYLREGIVVLADLIAMGIG